jgi:hypothetical protein
LPFYSHLGRQPFRFDSTNWDTLKSHLSIYFTEACRILLRAVTQAGNSTSKNYDLPEKNKKAAQRAAFFE